MSVCRGRHVLLAVATGGLLSACSERTGAIGEGMRYLLVHAGKSEVMFADMRGFARSGSNVMIDIIRARETTPGEVHLMQTGVNLDCIRKTWAETEALDVTLLEDFFTPAPVVQELKDPALVIGAPTDIASRSVEHDAFRALCEDRWNGRQGGWGFANLAVVKAHAAANLLDRQELIDGLNSARSVTNP